MGKKEMDQCHHGNPIPSLSQSYNKKQKVALTKQSTNNRMMMQSEHFPLVELTITCRVTGIEEVGVVVAQTGLGVEGEEEEEVWREEEQTEPLPLPISNYQTPPALPTIFLIVFSYVSMLLLLLLSLYCMYLLNAWHCGPSPTNKDQSLTLIPMIRLLIRGALT